MASINGYFSYAALIPPELGLRCAAISRRLRPHSSSALSVHCFCGASILCGISFSAINEQECSGYIYSLSSSPTNMADHSVSTVLCLTLHPSPGTSRSQARKPSGVDLCPSIWCFNADQESPVNSALPNLQQFAFTLLSPSTLSNPPFDLDLFPVSAIFEDFLEDKIPSMKRKREKIGDSGTDKSGSDEGGAKKQKGERDGQWIKKLLSLSDVNDSSRLLLGKEYVRKYVLPLMDDERRAACESREGLRVKVWDLDTISEHELRLKQWKTGSFLLTSNWRMEFVKRRNLKEGDSIGLMWDFEKLGFFFHKFNAQS